MTTGADTPDGLVGKRVLVTGASGGIGAAACMAFARLGAVIAVHWRSHLPERLLTDLRGAGGSARGFRADLATSQGPRDLVHSVVSALGGLDVLVNNAGDMIRREPLETVEDSLIDQVYAINMRAVVLACQAAIPALRATRGCIINVSSVAARTGGAGGSVLYAGAKGFVSSFTRGLAKELAVDGVRVNAISPGVIDTKLLRRTTSNAIVEAALAQTPLRRLGTPADCAGAFVYLASPAASGFLTGQIIEVTGGL